MDRRSVRRLWTYFGVGALLALAFERGVCAGDVRLSRLAWLAFGGYVTLYSLGKSGCPLAGLGCLQQTLLALVFAGMISGSLAGFPGIRGRVLDHPAVQHVGRVSYGLYLFHAPVPLLLGVWASFLWDPVLDGPLLVVRLAAFALVSWALAWLCWRWLEGPERLRWRRLVERSET